VCELGSGEIVRLHEGRERPYTVYRRGEKPLAGEDEETLKGRVDAALAKQPGKTPAHPAADHPWRKAGAIAAAKAAAGSATPPAS